MATRRNWTQAEIHRLRELATGQRMSTYDLAKALRRDPETVRKAMVKHHFPRLSRGRAMELNYFWKGGRKIDKGGYILVKCPGHPFLTSSGYIREHRLVKDDNPQNNNSDNLEVIDGNNNHLRETLKDKIPSWTPDGRANILRAAQLKHERARKPPKPPFDRRAWALSRQRNANGEFAHQITVDNGS